MIIQSGIQTLINFPKFLRIYLFLKESQWWKEERLNKYQLEQLKKLIDHSYENVPYYTKLFDKLNLTPKDINSLEDLHKLPFLTKDIVRKNLKDLKAINYPEKKFQKLSTGGSSGQPLQFFIEKGDWLPKMMAFTKIQNNWSGRSYFDKWVNITALESPFEYQLFGRTLALSSFYMNEKYFPMFIKKIRKFKPKHILSYPSAITNLARYMKKNNLEKFQSVKSILCVSETLHEWQRSILEEMFQCRIYDQYCLRESVALGISCEYSNFFHMFPEFGITELISNEGKQVRKEDEIGEIVGTSFLNYIFPFIRYKTGDLGVYTTEKCQCERNYPRLKRIEGRLQEFVVSKSNKFVSLTGIYGLVAESSTNVNECQFYQDKMGEIVLKIVKTDNYSKADSESIQKSFQKRFGNEFNLKISQVDHIPRTETGKYRFLIQKLSIE
jgi:phenylacetate-CoA ligase